ncbi:MAG: prepilin-type N-terminal cleavage/methylation domain-containing protein [Candidatus Omnitrophota bacterium]
MKSDGFTLLELIIVIIVIGVLTSLALPRLFSAIESSRGAEALSAMASIRSRMDTCVLMNPTEAYNKYLPCDNFDILGMEDPGTAPGAHFRYEIWPFVEEKGYYVIVAFRNSLDGGSNDRADRIKLEYLDTHHSKGLSIRGYGVFSNIRQSSGPWRSP